MDDEKVLLMEACIVYFKARPVYQKLFTKMRKKFESLGHFGGKVTMSSLSDVEKEHLEGFFQRGFRYQKSVTISAEMMQNALDGSRFADLNWTDILNAYFDETLIGKRVQEQQENEKRKLFFRQFLQCDDMSETGKRWLKQVLETKDVGYQALIRAYKEDREELSVVLGTLLRSIDHLPVQSGNVELLPVFSARLTGNPHFFDEKTLAGRLLELYLSDWFSDKKNSGIAAAEWKTHLLYRAGILRDDLSNYTLAYGIRGIKKDGTWHEGLAGFYKMREPVQCTLMTLGQLEGATGTSDVYVVENPAMFSVLMSRNPEKTFVCSNGQPRLATLVLLDFLSRKSQLWYAGDFDPEGLIIAQNLKRRYGQRIRFWNYQKDVYYKVISDVDLDEVRLNKLNSVQDVELRKIADEMLDVKRAAYQEAMLDLDIWDI